MRSLIRWLREQVGQVPRKLTWHDQEIPEPGMLGHLEQSEWFPCMGSAAPSPPLAQDGYQWEGIWVQILPWQTDCIIVHIGGSVPSDASWDSLLLSQVAKTGQLGLVPPEAYCLKKTLTGGTILSALSSCVRLDSLCAMSFSRLECVGLQSPVSWDTRSGFPIEGHKEGLTSSPPSSFIQATTVVLSVVMTAISFNQMSWHS